MEDGGWTDRQTAGRTKDLGHYKGMAEHKDVASIPEDVAEYITL